MVDVRPKPEVCVPEIKDIADLTTFSTFHFIPHFVMKIIRPHIAHYTYDILELC